MKLPDSLERYRPKIEATFRPCLAVTAGSTTPKPLASRVGGFPTLPEGFSLPQNSQVRPLRFLAQINFEEMPALVGFPAQGLLQFYVADTTLYGVDYDRPTVPDGFRLLYFKDLPRPPYADIEGLQLPEPECFPIRGYQSVGLNFEPQSIPVSGADYRASSLGFENDDDSDTYWDCFPGEGHRLGGYPGFSQDDPRASREELRDYELLFQLDSDDALNLMWGDAGIANFFIQSEALRNADFSDVMYYWECG